MNEDMGIGQRRIDGGMNDERGRLRLHSHSHNFTLQTTFSFLA